MINPPYRKYLDQLRFVVFTIFVFYASLLLFDFYSIINDHGISFLLHKFNFNSNSNSNSSEHDHQILPHEKTSNLPSNYSENICFGDNKTSPNSDYYNVSNESTNVSSEPTNNMSSESIMMSPITNVPTTNMDPCSGKYIYVYNLPSRFNEDLVKKCHHLMKWVDMCSYLTNYGLGLKVIEKSKSKSKPKPKFLSKNGWYKTNQFSLEVIFHNTMKHYKCLTKDSSLASAVYVPFYAGLDASQYLWEFNVSMRDSSPKALMKWLSQQPQWKRMWGRDHFMVAGRIGWDFRRKTDKDSDWGTNMMFLPEAKNMSLMNIESGGYENDLPIPYPTYFHPSKESEMLRWQERMRRSKRPYLFTFAGAPRPSLTDSIRSELIKHCRFSRNCKLLACYDTKENVCDDPASVISVFQKSVFCLQPPGDSYTRRSTFDSILAGCIPVFFHPKSAYTQYVWHFPNNGSSYSVYIPEIDVKENRVMVNETLSRISHTQVLAMREQVIRLIPRVTYGDPRYRFQNSEDAFDLAVNGILGRIEGIRMGSFVNINNTNSNIVEGKNSE